MFSWEQIGGFLFIYFIGWLGFVLFRRMKSPSPALLGSIFATGILSAAGYYPKLELSTISFLAKTATGVMIGRQVNRQFFAQIRSIALYVVLFSAGMFAISMIAGYMIYCMSSASLITALLGGAAAGIAEMTAFGISVQADVVTILFMQLFRLVLAIGLSSWTATFIGKIIPGKAAATRLTNLEETFFAKQDYVFLTVAAVSGAWLLVTLNVPNGAMLGAMLACGALSVCIRKTYRFDSKVGCVAQIALGLVISQNITPDVVRELRLLFLPGLATSAFTLIGSVLFALVLYKFSTLDVVTCILCTSPAGLTQSAFLAYELGADPLIVSIFQTCRLLSIIAFYPWIVTWLT